jgi:hypothetical protein
VQHPAQHRIVPASNELLTSPHELGHHHLVHGRIRMSHAGGNAFLTWWQRRTMRADLLFALLSVAFASFAVGELATMRAETPETGVEAFYNFAITPALQLSFDAQWISPGIRSSHDAEFSGATQHSILTSTTS